MLIPDKDALESLKAYAKRLDLGKDFLEFTAAANRTDHSLAAIGRFYALLCRVYAGSRSVTLPAKADLLEAALACGIIVENRRFVTEWIWLPESGGPVRVYPYVAGEFGADKERLEFTFELLGLQHAKLAHAMAFSSRLPPKCRATLTTLGEDFPRGSAACKPPVIRCDGKGHRYLGLEYDGERENYGNMVYLAVERNG